MTEPKWHNNGWGFPCACTTGHHTEYITIDGLNALEERITDLEARAALAPVLERIAEPKVYYEDNTGTCLRCGLMTEFVKDGELQHYPDCAQQIARAALDALPSTTKETQ